MLQLTRHSEWRIQDRAISPDDLAAALSGRRICKDDGSEIFYDNHSHTAIAVAEDGAIPTVYHLKKKILKQRYSR